MKNTNKVTPKASAKFKVGDFVRWYEAYADGFLGRDAGWGVIQSVREYTYYRGDYINYVVLRNKHGDTMTFAEDYLESKPEFEERMKEERKKSEQKDDSVRS